MCSKHRASPETADAGADPLNTRGRLIPVGEYERTDSIVQKDINKLAAEGFRVSPGTLLVLQANPTVIVEKAKTAFKLRYQYIIKETARISSGEREVEKVQEQGYTSIGETDTERRTCCCSSRHRRSSVTSTTVDCRRSRRFHP
jgi:hypothetical protein